MKRRSKGRLKLPRKVKRILTVCITCLAIVLLIGAVASLFDSSSSSGGGGSTTTRPPGTILGPSGGNHDPVIPDIPSDPEEEPEEPELVGSEGLEYVSNGDGTCAVVGIGTFKGTDLVIPSRSPEGERVTAIGENAFLGCESLKSIVLPKTIKEIGYRAFKDCVGLTDFVLPDSLENVAPCIFENCSNLACLTLPFLGYQKDDEKFGFLGYYFGSFDKTVHALLVPISLNTITVTGERISPYAFYNCEYIETVNVSERLLELSEYAFYGCKRLKDFKFPELEEIPAFCFGNCIAFEKLNLPDSLKVIGNSAFVSCNGFAWLEIPDSVEKIGTSAFEGCSNIIYADMSDNLNYLGNRAFFNCTSLSYLDFPKHLEYLGGSALTSTVYLKNKIGSSSVIYLSDWLYYFRSHGEFTIKDDTYGIVNGAGYYAYSADSTTSNSVQKVFIPNSVVYLGSSSFYGCTSLTEVFFESNSLVKEIGASVFSGCSSLRTITLPESLERINSYAFSECKSLKALVIPKNVNYIGSYAFDITSSSFASCTFEDVYDWYISGDSVLTESDVAVNAVDLTNKSTAAQLLRSTYTQKYWIKRVIE